MHRTKENKWSKETLENKDKKNKDIIALLEEKVKSLEKNNPGSKTQTFVQTGSQTEDDDILFCQVCEYPADDLYSLGEHVGEYHAEKPMEDIGCDSCGESFPSQNILNEHESKNHRNEELSGPKQQNTPQPFKNRIQFKCKFCEEGFEK